MSNNETTTRDHIKAIAIKMVKKDGLINLSRRSLSVASGIPDGSFPHVMGCTFGEFVEELRSEGIEPGQTEVVNRSRVNSDLRRDQILDAAVTLSISDGYHKITREQIAAKCGISPALISNYFGTMINLRRDIVRHAIKCEIVEIIAQGLANADNHARKAPDSLRKAAVAYLCA